MGIGAYTCGGDLSRATGISSRWGFRREDGNGFELHRDTQDRNWVLQVSSDITEAHAREIVSRAAAAAARMETKEDVCYSTQLVSDGSALSSRAFTVQFMRTLGDQEVISGRRRLHQTVLLDFQPEGPGAKPSLFAPTTTIAVKIFAPGPGTGPLGQRVAENVLELTRLICVVAMGRPVTGPAAIFRAKLEDSAAAHHIRFDPSILTLARSGTSLDIFGNLPNLGGLESVWKVRGSLVAFDAAINQSNPDVATILFVSGIEALVTPNTEWRRERPVARFIDAVLDLCPDFIDTLVNHRNTEDAFDIRFKGGPQKKRKQFLDRIYELRSLHVHSGLPMTAASIQNINSAGSMRVALLSQLHWNVLIAFLRGPRSFLTGHPNVWPGQAGSATQATP
jgi:hypothetical protein